MRKPVLLIFVNVCILILVFVLLGQSLFVVQRVARARRVSGQVLVQHGGSGAWQPLLVGSAISPGDVVRTQPKSWAEFGWQGGTRWRLAPESSLTVQKALLNPTKSNEIANFRLENGEVLMRVTGTLAPTSHFEIETPNAIAAVTGTVFSVAFERGQTQVEVFEGQVDVYDSSRSKRTNITRGQKTQVSLLDFANTTEVDPRDFDAQPTFLKPELSSNARAISTESALLSGHTESGDSLTIDDAPVAVSGTGAFLKRVKIPAGKKGWNLQSIDKYGAKTEVWQPVPAGYSG